MAPNVQMRNQSCSNNGANLKGEVMVYVVLVRIDMTSEGSFRYGYVRSSTTL